MELYNHVMRLDFFASRYRLDRNRLYWAVYRYDDKLCPVIGIKGCRYFIGFLNGSIYRMGEQFDIAPLSMARFLGITIKDYEKPSGYHIDDAAEREPVCHLMPAKTYKTEQGFVMKARGCRLIIPVDRIHRYWKNQYCLAGVDNPEVHVTWPTREEEIPDCVMDRNFLSWWYGFPLEKVCWATVYTKNEDGIEDVDGTLWYKEVDRFVFFGQDCFLEPVNYAGCVTVLEEAVMERVADGFRFRSANYEHTVSRKDVFEAYSNAFFFQFGDV